MRPLVIVALVGFSTLVPAAQGRDEAPYTVSLRVDLVVVNASVADSKGRRVAGLRATDFEVREDGHPQAISLFNADDTPATVGLVIDGSGSMLGKRDAVVNAALAFATVSNTSDELFLVTFNDTARLGLPSGLPFTGDLNVLGAALSRPLPAGRTAMYDALALGLEHVATGTHDRKALVLLSDGGDNASRLGLSDVLRLADASSATIYTIGIYDDIDGDQNPRALKTLAESTGGRAYFPASLSELDRIWREVAGSVMHQYTIGYNSTNSARDGRFRRIAVTARGAEGNRLRVTAKRGYRASGPEVAP